MKPKKKELLTKKNLDKVKTIAIYGDVGTGKSALAHKILTLFKDEQIYVIKHPKPEIIEVLGWKNLRSLEEMERLQDVVLYFDEPQLSISIYDHKANRIIGKMCSLARQLGITFIISSSDTRIFGKYNEAFFDLWLIKSVDFEMVKQGSKIKKAIKNHCKFEPAGFRLEDNEYLAESRKLEEFNGKHTFKLPGHWSEEHSKPYRN